MIITNLKDTNRLFYNDKVVDKAYFRDSLVYQSDEPKFVTIGGLRWSECNLGAQNPSDVGLFFAWSETHGYAPEQIGTGDGQRQFSSSEYTRKTKYWHYGNHEFYAHKLENADDAAYQMLRWKMPSQSDLSKLVSATNKTYIEDYEGSGVNGWLFVDKTDETKKLFFPLGGIAYNGTIHTDGLTSYMSDQIYRRYPTDLVGITFLGMNTAATSIKVYDLYDTDKYYAGSLIRPILK